MFSLFRFCLTLLVFSFPLVSLAQTAAPRTVNFQGVLVDDGGNVLHDLQETDLELSIIDGTGEVLYTEIQHVPVIHSAVSVLVGRGTAEGIPYDAFDPTTTKLLRVKLVDQSIPQEVLELASVPYAIYAQTLAAPIGSDLILDGSVARQDLSAELIAELENNLTTDLDAHRTERDAHHASNIDLDNVFVNAGGNNVQDVLQGIDNAISIRINQDTELAGDIADEATARADADAAHAATTTGVHGVGTGKIVGTTLVQTLTGKTLTSPTLSDNIIKRNDGDQWTLPDADSQTFVGASATQTLTNKTLGATTMTGDLLMSPANIQFDGSTADANKTTLTVADPTAPQTITLPDVTGTVITSAGGTMTGNISMTDPGNCTQGTDDPDCLTVDGVDVSYLEARVPEENLDSRYVNVTGDTMTGDIAMDNAACLASVGHNCRVDGVDVSALKNRVDGIEDSQEPAQLAFAYGRCSNSISGLLGGAYNVTKSGSPSQCEDEITYQFPDDPDDSNYVVIFMPTNAAGGGAVAECWLASQTSTSFAIDCDSTTESYSFVVFYNLP